MSNHGLTTNEANEPVCLCGLRPDILDEIAPVGRLWRARKIILEHADALNDPEAPSPSDPFLVDDAKFPRAGVRRTEAGKWLLTLWDGMGIQHHIPEPEFTYRTDAFDYGWMTIGACRQAGTNLNGWEAA
ncbi:hypothetical protein J7I84_08965 [Arthrobacter sp. ISL-85]|uniref:hypothetical protein n=1 Tax=Arthrobacter sp. ISL-85 TaxID=2819115 RepID=UPI001BE79404|nr:hypothetical protein [Arthrobacter sp. ISL-85]MBT2566623.1 hypothetical protein [Arthrobacter sp. ISL-85]